MTTVRCSAWTETTRARLACEGIGERRIGDGTAGHEKERVKLISRVFPFAAVVVVAAGACFREVVAFPLSLSCFD